MSTAPTQREAGERALTAAHAKIYRDAIEQLCEGWTLPAGVRKILETALWTEPSLAQSEAPASTIDSAHVSLNAIHEAYTDAFGPLDPNLTANDIEWHICELIKQATPEAPAQAIQITEANMRSGCEAYHRDQAALRAPVASPMDSLIADLHAMPDNPDSIAGVLPAATTASASEPQRIPDSECAQGSCARMSTGCFGKCSLSGHKLPIMTTAEFIPGLDHVAPSRAPARQTERMQPSREADQLTVKVREGRVWLVNHCQSFELAFTGSPEALDKYADSLRVALARERP